MGGRPVHSMPGEHSGSTAITIPRWIEVNDRLPYAPGANPARSQFYVVSPSSNIEDAIEFAQVYNQRERMERTFQFLDGSQGAAFVLIAVGIGAVVITQVSYLWLLLPVLMFGIFQFMLQDAAHEVCKPLDIEKFSKHAGSPMLFRIHVTEYRQAMEFATQFPDRAHEAHLLMWRIYSLRDLLATGETDLAGLQAKGEISTRQVAAAQAKLVALAALVKDSQISLRAVLSPPRRVLPLGRDRLLELMHNLDTALSQGIDELTPRIETERERLAQYEAFLEATQEKSKPVVAPHTEDR